MGLFFKPQGVHGCGKEWGSCVYSTNRCEDEEDEESSRRRGKIVKVFWREKIIEEFVKSKY